MISLTVAIIAYSTVLPNSVIEWIKLSFALTFAFVFIKFAKDDVYSFKMGFSYVRTKNVVKITMSPSTIWFALS